MRQLLPVLALLIAIALPVALHAQKESPVRTVHGQVVDKDGNNIAKRGGPIAKSENAKHPQLHQRR